MHYIDTLRIAKSINKDLEKLNISKGLISSQIEPYDVIVTNNYLRRKTEKLFKDGHHARAVEEAFKLVDNNVKKKAGLQQTDFTGAKLMQKVFSLNNPILKLNEGKSVSEKDEQLGYMQIFSGCMTGIRNPRAHESDWEDTEGRALQLLGFANHLIERVSLSDIVK